MCAQSHFARWIEAEVEPEDLEELYKEVNLCVAQAIFWWPPSVCCGCMLLLCIVLYCAELVSGLLSITA